jgi:hypothetical protein
VTVGQISILPSTPLGRQKLGGALPLTVFGLAGLLLLVAAAGGMLVPALALAALGALCWAAWRWPLGAVVALVALMYLHGFVPLFIFDFSRSTLLARVYGLWDDVVVAVLLLRMIHEALLRRQAPRLHYLDLLIVVFLGLTAIYIFYPGTVVGNSLYNRFAGFRFDAFFMLAYFVGRGITLRRHHVRWLLLALIPAALATTAVAVWQWVALDQSNAFFARLGFADFMQAVGGVPSDASRSRELAGAMISRPSGLLLGDLALAYYQLLAIPLAAALFFSSKRVSHQLAAGLFFLAMVGTLLMTMNRTAIVASLVVVPLITIWGRSYAKTIAVTVTVATIAVLVFLVSGISGTAVQELNSAQEGSAQGHISAVQTSLEVVREEPLGRGLGTAGPVAVSGSVRVPHGLNTESWYLQLAAEIGIAGAVLFFLILLTATAGAFMSYLNVKDRWLRTLTLGMAGAGVGVILMGAVHHVWWISIMDMVFWIMMGIALRAPQLEREWGAEAKTA